MIDGVLKATSTALPPANPPEGAPRQIPAPRRRKSCRRDASQLRSTPSADQFLWATGALARSSKSCRRRPRWCARFLRTICGLARLAHWPLRSNVKASSQNQGVSSTAKQSGFDLRRSNHPMSLSQANKKGVRYRYYVSQPGASAKEPRSIVVSFAGEHPAILEQGLFAAVQVRMTDQTVRTREARTGSPAILIARRYSNFFPQLPGLALFGAKDAWVLGFYWTSIANRAVVCVRAAMRRSRPAGPGPLRGRAGDNGCCR